MWSGVRFGRIAKTWKGSIDEISLKWTQRNVESQRWGREICEKIKKNIPNPKYFQSGNGGLSKIRTKETETNFGRTLKNKRPYNCWGEVKAEKASREDKRYKKE